jgi:hypothetical protein
MIKWHIIGVVRPETPHSKLIEVIEKGTVQTWTEIGRAAMELTADGYATIIVTRVKS